MFPWADFRTTKGAIKLHIGLNHNGFLPEFVTITEGKKHDVTVGRTLKFPKGSIVAIDKGYNDYSWYNQLTEKGIFFVTRLKSNAKYRVVKRQTVIKSKGLTCDQVIEFTGSLTSKKCPSQLRRIGYKDAETGKHYIFLTNNFKLSAKTIADIYKARWQVALNNSLLQSVSFLPNRVTQYLIFGEYCIQAQHALNMSLESRVGTANRF